MADYDLNQMFDRYLYDYFVKRNMHQVAEIFRNEANLAFDPNVAPAIDVEEGFMHEWWTMSYEFRFFRAFLSQNVDPLGKAPSTMLKPRLEATQERNASPSGQYLMSSQTNKQLLINSASTVNTGSKSVAWHGSDKVSQVFSPSSQQEELLTSSPGTCTPVNFASTIDQKVESFVNTSPKTANTAFIEETDPWIDNLINSFWAFEQDQKGLSDKLTLGEEFPGLAAQTLLADGTTSESETSDCTSNFPRLSTAADTPTVHQLGSNKAR